MSLWLQRGAITRAVAGQLSAPRETRLRRHLAGCPACRQHYDAVSLAASGSAGATAAARERARLLHALASAGGGATSAVALAAPSRTRRRWALASLALVPVLGATAILLSMRARTPADFEVTERGANDPPAGKLAEEARAALVLRFYARRQAPGEAPGPVRLVGEMPGSGELRVARDEQLQIAYAGLNAVRYLVVAVTDRQGRMTLLYPRADPAPPAALAPTQEPRLLGPPFSPGTLGSHLRVGATVARKPGDRAPAELSAELLVDP